MLPSGSDANFTVTSITETKVERAVKPESIALGVFGAIAALAALAIGALAISRVLGSEETDLSVLRALGASPGTTVADGLVGVLGAIVVGALLAVAVAISLSPLSPLGPIRAVYHPAGIAFDWTVLGFGLLVLIGGLGAIALALAYRGAPHRLAAKSHIEPPRDSRLLQMATSSGLSASGAVGLRFALQSGRGRTSVPARSLLVGATLAVVVVTATLTFSSGLHTLVSRPALYGWNWSYALTSENVVPPQALAALNRDPDVAAWSGYHNISVQIDGQTVPLCWGTTTPPWRRRSFPDTQSMATTRSSWVPARSRCCTNALATPSSVRSAPRTPPRSTSRPSSWSSQAPPHFPRSAAPATSPTTLPWEPEPSSRIDVSPAFLTPPRSRTPTSMDRDWSSCASMTG